MRVNTLKTGFACLAVMITASMVALWSTGNRRAETDVNGPIIETHPKSMDLVIEGFGRNTIGGKLGKVYLVSNLNDSGPFSLRDLLNRPGPRIIKFGVSGTIRLQTGLVLVEPLVTIDGSDAPNGGIAIDGPFAITASQVIIRHVRFRNGDLQNPADAVLIGEDNGSRPSNIVLDHCSISWGGDGNVDIVNGASDVTIQWCILSENLGPGATLIKYGATRITLHHNLFANSRSNRNPVVHGGEVDVVNNVVYRDFASTAFVPHYFENLMGVAPDTAVALVNFVGNYYKAGSAENIGRGDRQKQIYLYGDRAYASQSGVYLQGNLGPSRPDDSLPQEDIAEQTEDEVLQIKAARFEHPLVTTSPAMTAYKEVLARAGATLPCRDEVDRRVVTYVANGKGKAIVQHPGEVGGWPDLALPCYRER
jgi:pectate lyase